MTAFNDYEYFGPFSSTGPGQTWANLAPYLHQVSPPPALGAPPKRPAVAALLNTGMVAGMFLWHAATVGYGEPALYAVRWLLEGLALGPAQVASLRRLAASRAAIIQRAYYAIPGTPTTVSQRDIYPLIEQAEKTAISFLLGNGLAASSGPAAVLARSGIRVGRLFHAKLLECANTAQIVINTITTGKTPDFLAFDEDGGIHIFEAKGDGAGMSFKAISHGLVQIGSVQGVVLPASVMGPPAPTAPRTRNVCMAYFAKTPGLCDAVAVNPGIRSVVLHLPDNLAAPAAPNADPVRRALTGLYVLGVWAWLHAGSMVPTKDWLVFEYSFREGEEDVALRVAVPAAIFRHISEFYERCLAQPRVHAPLGPLLQELGQHVMEHWDDAAKWEVPEELAGYHRSPNDPWLFGQ